MTYAQIKTDVENVQLEFNTLFQDVQAIDTNGDMGTNLQAIVDALDAINTWATQGEQNSLITSFLADLKTVFNNYSATLAIVDLSGYGVSYGSGNGLSFSVSKDDVS